MINKIYNEDSLNLLKSIDDNYIDNCITDPPYGLNINSHSDKKDWDRYLPIEDLYKEIFRVVKLGSFNLFFSSSRLDLLYDNLTLLKSVGFNIKFTPIQWVYTKSSLKGLDIYKFLKRKNIDNQYYKDKFVGFQPRICTETIIVVQKPYNNNKSNIDNILENNNGYTNFLDTKIPSPNNPNLLRYPTNIISTDNSLDNGLIYKSGNFKENHKRNKTKGNYKGSMYGTFNNDDKAFNLNYGDIGSSNKYFDIDYWWEKRLDVLPESISKTFPFIIESKPTKKEKGDFNNHPTVKPINLMSYLILMFSKQNDIILDPFMGSGSTIISSIIECRNFIGIEKEEEYFNIVKKRINFK